jgi:cellulase/cellobiase CelA1
VPTVSVTSGVVASFALQSDWGSGYCAQVRLSSASRSPITWAATFPLRDHVSTVWNATLTVANGRAKAVGLGWDATVSATAPQSFGYCADRS